MRLDLQPARRAERQLLANTGRTSDRSSRAAGVLPDQQHLHRPGAADRGVLHGRAARRCPRSARRRRDLLDRRHRGAVMRVHAFNSSTAHFEKEKPMNTGLKWKAALFGTAALAALTGARVAGAAICGDLNGDGNRTIADAVRLQRALFVPNAADCGGAGSAACGDVNPASPGLGVDDAVVLEASLNNKPTLFSLCTGVGTTPCTADAGTRAAGET